MHERLCLRFPVVASAAAATFDAAIAAIVGGPTMRVRMGGLRDWSDADRHGYIIVNARAKRDGRWLPVRAVSPVFALGRDHAEAGAILRAAEGSFERALRARFDEVEITFRALDEAARREAAERARREALRAVEFAMFLEVQWEWVEMGDGRR